MTSAPFRIRSFPERRVARRHRSMTFVVLAILRSTRRQASRQSTHRMLGRALLTSSPRCSYRSRPKRRPSPKSSTSSRSRMSHRLSEHRSWRPRPSLNSRKTPDPSSWPSYHLSRCSRLNRFSRRIPSSHLSRSSRPTRFSHPSQSSELSLTWHPNPEPSLTGSRRFLPSSRSFPRSSAPLLCNRNRCCHLCLARHSSRPFQPTLCRLQISLQTPSQRRSRRCNPSCRILHRPHLRPRHPFASHPSHRSCRSQRNHRPGSNESRSSHRPRSSPSPLPRLRPQPRPLPTWQVDSGFQPKLPAPADCNGRPSYTSLARPQRICSRLQPMIGHCSWRVQVNRFDQTWHIRSVVWLPGLDSLTPCSQRPTVAGSGERLLALCWRLALSLASSSSD